MLTSTDPILPPHFPPIDINQLSKFAIITTPQPRHDFNVSCREGASSITRVARHVVLALLGRRDWPRSPISSSPRVRWNIHQATANRRQEDCRRTNCSRSSGLAIQQLTPSYHQSSLRSSRVPQRRHLCNWRVCWSMYSLPTDHRDHGHGLQRVGLTSAHNGKAPR